jgi:hypothetical protein
VGNGERRASFGERSKLMSREGNADPSALALSQHNELYIWKYWKTWEPCLTKADMAAEQQRSRERNQIWQKHAAAVTGQAHDVKISVED